MRGKKTVIIVEDEEVLLEAYKYFFESFDDYSLKGAYLSVEDALAEYEEYYPDIIISDISLPGISGVEGIKKFKRLDKEVKILILSIHDDVSFVLDAIKNFADGYLTKPVKKEELLKALNALEVGGAPLSDDVSRKLIGLFQKKSLPMFSERENEIVELLMNGHTYNSIAEHLFITHSTVNYHIQNIYAKLDVTSKSEALKKIKVLYSNS